MVERISFAVKLLCPNRKTEMAAKEGQGKTSKSTPALRVAWVLSGDLRPYRVPFVNKLADSNGIDLTVFHGTPRTRFGAPDRLPTDTHARVELLQDLKWPMAGQRTAWLKGTGKILQGGFDVIVCQETVHNLTTWAIALTQRLFAFRFVLHGHFYGNTQRHRSSWQVRAAARRMLARRAKAFLAYTERGRNALIESGSSDRMIFVTRNTLDTERLMSIADDVPASEVTSIQQVLGLGSDPVLLMLGRLLPEKRVDVLMEAVGILSNTQDKVDLLVIGDGTERAGLEQRARGKSHIRFLGAIYDERQLAPYLLLSDLLVIPGRVGLTCVHGFTASLPAMTASADVVHQSPEYDYIEDGVNGVLVPELSPMAFAQAIAAVVQDKNKLSDMKRSARRSADSLGMTNMVDEFVKGVRFANQPPIAPRGPE